jgi:flavin-dependent dehydrogenase
MTLTLRDVAALAEVPHLSDVSLDDVNLLAGLLQVEELEDGQRIIEEGADDDDIVIVLEGELSVVSTFVGQQRELNRVGPGEMLGLLALVDNAPRSASCIAAGPVRVARLARQAYRRAAAASPALALAFHRALGAQLARDLRNISTQLAAEPATGEPPPSSADADVATDCDVAVIGAGPLGMMYAQWLKRMQPAARVVMLERREVPGYKVGESTLSTTVRAFLDVGFTMPQMRRLFGNKTGIRFWWAGTESERPEREVDVVDIEETFQVERRVFEMAFQRLTREAGVDLRTGTQVELERSDLDGAVKRLACEGPDGEYMLTAKIICDATGPAAVLPRHLGMYRKDASLYDTFQTNTYFAYFRQKKPVPLDRWQDPATRHLCTPQGWVWFITLHSWEAADDETMAALVDDVMDHPSDDDADLPSRRELAARHGTDFSLLTSVGITVREDMDTAAELPIQQRFEHYVQRYPALAWILEHYELVQQPYREKRRPYAAFLGLVHDSTQIAGDGWVSIGDSAQFTNPLFSLGMNYGSGTAYMAAASTAAALASGDTSRAAFAAYEQYGRDILPVLLHETDYFYRSWAHPQGFEQTLMSKFHFGALDVTQRGVYTETDPYVFDLLNPAWLDIVHRVRDVEKRYEAAGDPAGMVAAIAEITEPFNAECRVKATEIDLDFGRIFTNFDSNAQRHEGREKPRGYFRGYQCPTCNLWQDDTLGRCPVCATENPQRFVPSPEPTPEGAQAAPVVYQAVDVPVAPAGGTEARVSPRGRKKKVPDLMQR